MTMGWVLLAVAAWAAPPVISQEVRLRAADGVEVFGTYYPGSSRSDPLVLLFHMSGSNRHEYAEIAPELVRLGFGCLAIDQRSGGTMWNQPNQTVERLGAATGFLGALPDLEAALTWARTRSRKILVLGSSYTAGLVFLLAARHPEVAGVLAFSPGEYLPDGVAVRGAAAKVRVPVFVTGAKNETEQVRAILAAVASPDKVQFVPRDIGLHGALVLSHPLYKDEYWRALRRFLSRFR
ncbi:MAG TPA: alpha/beta hydrolase [Meiothermus sp.]|nr:alpha/beta hydrolase [Meiothermus sp.]